MQPTREQPPELQFEPDEEHEIRRWRFRQFLSLGFDFTTAVVMASAPIDLAAARRLVALGCPLETAARILL